MSDPAFAGDSSQAQNDTKNYMHILAIESSCDETAASVVETNGNDIRILSNVIASQIELHKPFGGVFPEHASRAHAEKIVPVIEEALGDKKMSDIDLVAVTTGPGLIGSLLVGVNAAKTLAFAFNKPIIGINHWLGHIYSNFISHPEANAEGSLANASSQILRSAQNDIPVFPALILIVSGGHTGLVLMKSHTDLPAGEAGIETLGQTLDDAAGEAFDKVAKLLGLDYPGGPAISKAASAVIPAQAGIHLPRPMLNSKDYNFSFSGLKTAVLNEVRKIDQMSPEIKNQIATEFQQATIDVLIGKTIKAAYEFKPKSICLCGGVSANSELRKQMKIAVDKLPWPCSYHVPPMILSTDNAVMIGIAAAYQIDQKELAHRSFSECWDQINVNPNLKL